MRYRTLVLSFTVALLALGCAKEESTWGEGESSGSEPRVTLRVQFPPGIFEMVTEQTTDALVTITGGGRTEAQKMTQSNLQAVTLETSQPDADGNTTLTIGFKRLRQEITAPMASVFDTDDPSSLTSNPAGEVLAEMLQLPLTIKLDGEGEVVSVTGMEEIWDRLAAANPRSAAALGAMNQKQDGAAFAKRMTQPMAFAPEGPVGEGAVWYVETTIPVPMVGDSMSRIKCRLVGLEGIGEGQIAVIETIGTITTGDAKRMIVGEVAMEIETISLELDGVMKVLVDTGLLIEQSYDLTGRVRMAIDTGGRSASSRIDLSGKVKTTIQPAQVGPPK